MIRPPPTSTLFPYTTLFRSTTRGRESVAEAPHQSHAILDDREALVRRGRGQGHTRLEIHLVRRPHEARAQGVEETALPARDGRREVARFEGGVGTELGQAFAMARESDGHHRHRGYAGV